MGGKKKNVGNMTKRSRSNKPNQKIKSQLGKRGLELRAALKRRRIMNCPAGSGHGGGRGVKNFYRYLSLIFLSDWSETSLFAREAERGIEKGKS